ncbi:MAG TPA: cytochrome c oxidase assembly factor Coa1 family protein [Pyrinomonadaceae bacterium]|jgi:TonB family protein|nr:cytochrome c oxidase assembly factor Coa1 family protein [Pyrinomonadaceae bacterium]
MMNPNPAQFGGTFQQAAQQPKGCWGRNWKWLVPTGCLVLLIGVGAVVALIVFGVMSAVKSSEVYQGALRIVQSHPAAVERLGEPIKDGWFVTGNVNFQNESGNANLDIPLSGPKKSGRLVVQARYEGGEWLYEKLDLTPEGDKTISLLDRKLRGLADEDELDVEAPPPPASTSGQAVSGGVLDGKAVSKPQPTYPQIGKAVRAQGTVTVQVLVDEEGNVASAKAVSGHPLLQQAAVQAARQAKFAPTLLGGKPVKVSGVLTYNFVME